MSSAPTSAATGTPSEPAAAAEHECRDRARRRALRDAEDVGGGERVAGRRSGRARRPRRAPRRPAGRRRPRGPQLPDDELLRRVADAGHAPAARRSGRSGNRRGRGSTRRQQPRTTRPTAGTSTWRRRTTADSGPTRTTTPGRGTGGGRHRPAVRCRRTSATKNGAPTRASTIPAGSSPGRATTRPSDVGGQQQRRPEEAGAGDQPAVVGAGERAGDVRHDEPDEGDRPAGGGGGPAEQGDRGQPDRPRRPDARAQPAGDVLAEGRAGSGRARLPAPGPPRPR